MKGKDWSGCTFTSNCKMSCSSQLIDLFAIFKFKGFFDKLLGFGLSKTAGFQEISLVFLSLIDIEMFSEQVSCTM